MLPRTITATDPAYYNDPRPQHYRFIVQLVSVEVDDDDDFDTRLADVITLEPTREAIEKLLSPFLVRYRVQDFWVPEEEQEF